MFTQIKSGENNVFVVLLTITNELCGILALERAASKADAIRNKWKHKRKTRIQSEHEAVVKEEAITVADEVDTVHSQPPIPPDQVKTYFSTLGFVNHSYKIIIFHL